MKSNRAFIEIQVTVIYSRAVLDTETSECRVKWVICKTWTGILVNSTDPDQTTQNAVCLNYRKLREIIQS